MIELQTLTLFLTLTIAFGIGTLVAAVLAFALKGLPKPMRQAFMLWCVAMALCCAGTGLFFYQTGAEGAHVLALAGLALLAGQGLMPGALSCLAGRKNRYRPLLLLALSGWAVLRLFNWLGLADIYSSLYLEGCGLIVALLCLRESIALWRTLPLSAFTFAFGSVVEVAARTGILALFALSGAEIQFLGVLNSHEAAPLLLVLFIADLLLPIGLGLSVVEHLQHRFARQASQDVLTGLLNRAGFDERLSALSRKLSVQKASPHVLLMFKIKDLDLLRDRFGVSLSDALLRLTGKAAQSHLPEGGQAAHLRSNLFALLLPGLTPAEALQQVQTLERYLRVESKLAARKSLNLTLSAGATAIQPGDTPQEAIDRAGLSMEHIQRPKTRSRRTGPAAPSSENVVALPTSR